MKRIGEISKDIPSMYKIAKMSLEEMNAEIEKLAKRANTRMSALARYEHGEGATKVLQAHAAHFNPKAKGKTYAPRFSRAKAKTRQEGEARLRHLSYALSSKTSTITGLKNADAKRRKSFSDMLGVQLTEEEYRELVRLLGKYTPMGFDSAQIAEIYVREIKGNSVLRNQDVSGFLDYVERTASPTQALYQYDKAADVSKDAELAGYNFGEYVFDPISGKYGTEEDFARRF